MIHVHTSCLHLCAGEGRSGSGPESRISGYIVSSLDPQSDRPQRVAVTLLPTLTQVASSDNFQFADGPFTKPVISVLTLVCSVMPG